MRPLYERYPALAAVLPCAEFARLPTPVQPLRGLERGWIKRDDESHPVYGGNKVRKLEFVLAEIRARRARRVVSFGAVGTNAGVAIAALCREQGLDCELLLFDQPASPTVRENLLAMQGLGARLTHCGSLATTLLRFYLHPRRLDARTYFLFAGCSNPVATFGYVDAAFELARQIAAADCTEPEEIVVAASSSSTWSGLTLGCALAGLRARVVGVRVAQRRVGPLPACTPGTARAQMARALSFLRRHLPAEELPALPEPRLLDDYYGPGYGESTPEALAAMRRFAEEQGVRLEQTYTGKAAAAFLDRLRQSRGPVLFWNTYNSRPLAPLARDADPARLPAPLRAYARG